MIKLPGRAKLERFMRGRYGQDELNRVLSAAALAFCFVSIITRHLVPSSLSMILVIICIFRSFSRNTGARIREANYYFSLKSKGIRFFGGVADKVRQRLTHRIFTCPSCGQRCRVPKGKGRIRITCKRCGAKFIKKT
ncbi:Zn-finger domain protein [Treponema primitia ZAS-2]|uniref:Zn-finger domain protein n=1 Tax=Treponema primitia (strain ATCC BAA-887 / DSM 12427 / ZAS-2) TaxID=545694 RepID=F5YKA5_TREPZ|nr:Zn-finger domain-containing protein [Treponema primitia]AEF83960.1 Zn-finger domain protein [Treponema primitia ZAS-2]